MIASTKLDVKAMFRAKDQLINQIIAWYVFRVFPSWDIKMLFGEARLRSPNSVRLVIQ
ncbi:hypothetical protein [Vulcanisaeta distributa]|uniref:hypothetical protein n=1 Tax=Vulcanisaeta distributa TaxID=164451 RepID=UPI000AB807C0|nr:hypothetical protein [Vulcanisaeta distributa]